MVCSGKLRLCYRTVATRPAERRPTAPAASSACRQVAVVGATSSSTAALQCPSIMKRSTAARVRRVTPLASHGACRRNLCLPLCWHALTGGEGGGWCDSEWRMRWRRRCGSSSSRSKSRSSGGASSTRTSARLPCSHIISYVLAYSSRQTLPPKQLLSLPPNPAAHFLLAHAFSQHSALTWRSHL